MKNKKENIDSCTCSDGCTCGDDCKCTADNRCSENCTCENGHTCDKQCDCETKCTCQEEDKSEQYLNLARQVQADFENFRKHAIEDIKSARIAGQVSVIEAFLPCLDTFKDAKKMITDENVLAGVEMIENKILDTLKNLGVEKIESIGKVYDPSVHNVIAVMKNEEKENDIILEEYQAGYKFNGKVIRYSKVIVNKKED